MLSEPLKKEQLNREIRAYKLIVVAMGIGFIFAGVYVNALAVDRVQPTYDAIYGGYDVTSNN